MAPWKITLTVVGTILGCVVGVLLAWFARKAGITAPTKHSMPVVFVLLGGCGLVFMARYFIAANPEKPWDMTFPPLRVIPRKTRWHLAIGHAMCVPMLVLGIVGLTSLEKFERAITWLSPLRFFTGETDITFAFVALLVLAGAALFIGITRALPWLLNLGLTLLVVAGVLGIGMMH